ncbi:MAG: O-antigen ligase family protein [Acidobacteriota bacterium]
MIRHSGVGSATVTALMVAAVVLGPVPFGAVQPTPRALLQAIAFVALAIVLMDRNRQPGDIADVRWPVAALGAIGLWGFLQSLPWPEAVIRGLAPRLATAWNEAAALLAEAAPPASVSVAPAVSRQYARHWRAAAAALAAACSQGKERASRRVVFLGLLVAAVGQILYGTQTLGTANAAILGVEVPGTPGRLRGTFVNPDHFVFFLVIVLTCVSAWLWWSVRKALNQTKSSLDRRLVLPVIPLTLFVVLFAGIAWSGSRAGILVAVASVLVQGTLLSIHYRRWQLGASTFGLVLLGFGGIAFFGWRRGLERWLETSAYEVATNARLDAWAATFDLWLHAPLTGFGLGTFRQSLPLVQPVTMDGVWHHAHSDVLELLATAGLIAAALAVAGLVALYRCLWRVLRRGRRSEDRAAGLAGLGALSAGLLHSLVDFPIAMPANAFALLIVCGLAGGCGLVEPKQRRVRTTPKLSEVLATPETAP